MKHRSAVDSSVSLTGLARYYSRLSPKDSTDFFIDEIGIEDLIIRCDDLNLSPKRILELGSRTMGLTRALRSKYPHSRLVAVECCPQMMTGRDIDGIQTVVADRLPLPLESESFDMVVSNLSLDFWPRETLMNGVYLLRPAGVFMACRFGGKSLYQLADLVGAAGGRLRRRGLSDVMNIGNEMIGLGLIEPVVSSVDLELEYPDLSQLRLDLHRAGVSYRANEDAPCRRLPEIDDAAARSEPVRVTVQLVTAIAFKADS